MSVIAAARRLLIEKWRASLAFINSTQFVDAGRGNYPA